MMKKLILLFFLIYGLSNAQIERNFGNTPDPVPSASSFASYSNTPVSLATGVPEVAVPLFTLPTSNKNFSVSIGLTYHIYNVGIGKPAGEVGSGWSLSKIGVISRVINNELDEKYDNTSKPEYKKNTFDDVYHYNLPGSSGKFKFVRDTINNTFTLNNISGNNIKIEFTRTTNTATLILESFKITDDKGFKYIYDNYSISSKDGYKTNYRSAFYLSKILDENNIEIASLTYQKETKYSGTFVKYQNCNLTTITTLFGKITFENAYEPYWEDHGNSDPNKIQSVSLFDNATRQVSKYKFEYETVNMTSGQTDEKRVLSGLYRLDKNQNKLGGYSFQYGSLDAPSQMTGVLREMKLPEGGRIVYQYEANEVYTAVNYSDADNYTVKYPEIQRFVSNPMFFDTNTSRTYTFQIDVPRAIFVNKDSEVYYKDQYPLGIHDDPDTYNYQITYVIKKGSTVIASSGSPDRYLVTPGTYTIEIKTGFGNGDFHIGMIQTDPPPYRNAKKADIAARIKTIQYYDDSTLKKSINYEYNAFENTLNSSGDYFTLETCQSQEYDYLNSVILYNNVKEIYGEPNNNLGYTQYYFKTPKDFTGNGTRPHYNILSGGLLYKKEVYNPQNQLIYAENTDYVLSEINNVAEYKLCDGTTSKTSWAQSAATTSKTFFSDGSVLENHSEVTYSPTNFEPVYTKITAPDGMVTEKSIRYSSDLNNTKLINARILSTPLETEIKVNGKLISKAETKYDNPSSLLPTSVNSYEMQNQTAQTKIIFNAYDNYGNPLETQTPKGISTAIIYGYHNTKPIAKIEGASYAQIISLPAVQNAITASDAATPENESALLTALENMRTGSALKEYNVTTFTWDILTGMTSVTSPSGSKEMYIYDKAGRLEKILDQDGKTLKAYQYNYKQ